MKAPYDPPVLRSSEPSDHRTGSDDFSDDFHLEKVGPQDPACIRDRLSPISDGSHMDGSPIRNRLEPTCDMVDSGWSGGVAIRNRLKTVSDVPAVDPRMVETV